MTDIANAFADEVVTEAYTKLITVPGIDGPVALITLDNGFDHTKPNSFGPRGLLSFDKALDEAFEAKPAAIAVTGKPFIFAAGADLKGVPSISSREQGLELGRLGHKVFRRLRESDVPTFAFVNGVALGGGLEVGLHCHYRTYADNVGALGLPEAMLGLVPGWGGTQLLPNLIGPSNAVTVAIENPLNNGKVINSKKALELGIADVVLGSADFIEQSLAWAAKVIAGDVTPAGRRSTAAQAGTRPSLGPRRSSKARPRTTRPARCAPSSCSSWPAPPTSPTRSRSTPGSQRRTTRSPTCS